MNDPPLSRRQFKRSGFLDSKLRSCDLVKLRVRDVCQSDRMAHAPP